MKKLTMKKATLQNFTNYGIILLFFLICGPLNDVGGFMTRSLEGQLVPICVYIVMAVSLNLVVGISGELSLGHAGFMSIGAFSGAVVAGVMQNAVQSEPLRLLVAVVVGAILAAVFGFLIGIPVLRLRGDYLAIVTLAFGEIIKNIFNCLYVAYDSNGLQVAFLSSSDIHLEDTGRFLINGPQGATGQDKTATFFAGILLVMFTLVVVQNLIRSRTGRAIMAIRDNRIAAEACGLNATRYKMIAFVIAAALAGAAGALYGQNFAAVTPSKFDFNTSILVLVFVVFGGMGNITGSIVAAALLTVLPELLREFQDYRMLIYAIVLILVMIATNNPLIRGWIEQAAAWVKKLFTKKSTEKEAGNDGI
ncbi:MAG: branched-chain amino acid ABC transporter permease [Clostridia bacterium]|nr:branched-chain amino acid ABC transporter permease [Clostridia bacterium]